MKHHRVKVANMIREQHIKKENLRGRRAKADKIARKLHGGWATGRKEVSWSVTQREATKKGVYRWPAGEEHHEKATTK